MEHTTSDEAGADLSDSLRETNKERCDGRPVKRSERSV